MVTHLTTNPPVHRLSTAERTGSAIVDVLWSYVSDIKHNEHMSEVNYSGVFLAFGIYTNTIYMNDSSALYDRYKSRNFGCYH